MTNVNKKTAGKNKDSEKTTESKSPVTVKQQPHIEHKSYRIKYYPFSKIIVDIAPKS